MSISQILNIDQKMAMSHYLDDSCDGVLEAGSLSEDVLGVNEVDTVSAFPALDIFLWSNSSSSLSLVPELSLLSEEALMPCWPVPACCWVLGVADWTGLEDLVACRNTLFHNLTSSQTLHIPH